MDFSMPRRRAKARVERRFFFDIDIKDDPQLNRVLLTTGADANLFESK